jgi:hypothetical protein
VADRVPDAVVLRVMDCVVVGEGVVLPEAVEVEDEVPDCIELDDTDSECEVVWVAERVTVTVTVAQAKAVVDCDAVESPEALVEAEPQLVDEADEVLQAVPLTVDEPEGVVERL